MFGSGFVFGFTLSDVTAQVTAFLSNPVIVGLIAASLALLIIPQILQVVKHVPTGDETASARRLMKNYRGAAKAYKKTGKFGPWSY